MFDESDRQWFNDVLSAIRFLRLFPYPNQSKESVIKEYKDQVLAPLNRHFLSAVSRNRDELFIYQFVLEEVTAVVRGVNLFASLYKQGYLVPDAPYSTIDEDDAPPEVSHLVEWAERAVRSVSGEEWLLIIWRNSERPSIALSIY
jgi:hypothetical protein